MQRFVPPIPKRQSWRTFVVLPLVVMAVALFSFVAGAPRAQAATKADVIAALSSQGYYASNLIKSNTGTAIDVKAVQSTLASAVSDGGRHGSPTKIALLDGSIVGAQNSAALGSYAETLFTQLNMPKDTGVLVVVQFSPNFVYIAAPKLTDANKQAAINAGRGSLANDPAKGASDIARSAFGQIDTIKTTETGGTVTLVILILAVIVAVAVVVVVGRIAMHRSRLGKLKTQVSGIDTMVLDLSEDVDYLPDTVRDRAKSDFLTGSSATYKMNEQVRELQAATPIDLLFKNGAINQKFGALEQELQASQGALNNVKQLVQANK